MVISVMVDIILLINRCIETTLVEVIDNSLLGNLVNETVAVDKILINFSADLIIVIVEIELTDNVLK